MAPHRIVILGGGFAGTAIALRLEKLFRRNDSIDITLIDAENFFTFTPLLPEVPSGSIQPKHIVFPLRALLRRTKVRQARVLSIDQQARTVTSAHCGACGTVETSYDQLVLAFGSVPNYFGLPGIEEHGLTMKSLADATALHAQIIDRLEHADLQPDPQARRKLLTFVVAGGGFAGAETVAELNDFVRGAGRFYPRVADEEVRVVLIHSGDRILPEVSPALSEYALQQISRHGVEVRLQARVKSCTRDSVELASGEVIPTSTFVWAAGTAPSPLLNLLQVPRHKSGRVEVDAAMQVRGCPGLWAVGDSASIPDVVTGGVCPPTAQYALRQGRCLADNIAATIQGRPVREFRFKALGLLAGLGRRCAVAEILGWRFSGFIAWWLWRTIYLLKLPGFERKLRVALDWTLDLFFPRDIVYLRPLHAAHGPPALSLPVAEEETCPAPAAAAESCPVSRPTVRTAATAATL